MSNVDTTQTAPYQLMPDLAPDEFEALKDDIKRRGVLVAVEFDGDGNIIDGHHRLRAYNELIDEGEDIPMYDQKVVHFPTEDAKKEYVLAINLKRRHLSPEQKATLYAKLRLPPYNMTLQQIADVANVGVGTVWRALDNLPDEVQETLVQLQTVGKDGKKYPAMYQVAERVIIPGEKAERDHVASGYTSSDQSAEIAPKYLIVIEVPNEQMQASILEGLSAEPWATGDDVAIKAVIS